MFAIFLLMGIGIIALGLSEGLPAIRSSGFFVQRCFSGCSGVLLVVIGSVFVFFSLLVGPGGTRRMIFDSRDRILRFRRPVKGLGQHVPFGNIEAVEIVTDEHEAVAGKIGLVLSSPAGLRLGVATRSREDDLLRDASSLAAFIAVPVRDTRQSVVPNSSAETGEVVSVSRAFNRSAWSGSFRTHELVEAAPGVLVVKPTGGLRLFRGVFLGGGIAGLAMAVALLGAALFGEGDLLRSPTHVGQDYSLGMLAGAGIGILVGGAFVIVSVYALNWPPVFIDRKLGEVRGRKLRVAGRLVKQLPLRFVAAVQIASGLVSASDGPNYTAYQANLVLNQPPGERITLMAHSREQQVRADARRLAEFIGVPLLDHSIGAGEAGR